MLIQYLFKKFQPKSLDTIAQANSIIAEYQAQGFILTLRQLYYQFVARDLIPNTQRAYKRLGELVNQGRLAGLVSWEAIEDRTRNVVHQSHWRDPGHIIEQAAGQFRLDKWKTQDYRPEVWVEKEALAGVFDRVCTEEDIPMFSCRGYTSQSEMWGSSQRFRRIVRDGQTPVILHFGDHDPSGIDMTKDIINRMGLFGADIQLQRLALNMGQVRKHKPPPNPAKTTDSRYQAYIADFGTSSWELDALDPNILANLVRKAVGSLRDQEAWDHAVAAEQKDRDRLQDLSQDWQS